MSDKTLSLSVAIVCFQTDPEELSQLLKSLLGNFNNLLSANPGNRIALILIDNSEPALDWLSAVPELADMSARPGIVTSIKKGHGNIGYGRAHNLVLEDLESDYHLLLNTDLIVDEDALVNGLSYLEKNAAVALLSPQVTGSSGRQEYLCKTYPSVLTLAVRGFLPGFLRSLFADRLARYEKHNEHRSAKAFEAEIASGCFMLTRTAALKSVTGFDERYFLYFEDFDLCLRMAKFGKIVYLPTMRIVHNGGQAARKGFRHIVMFLKSGWQFFSTHGWRWFKQ